MKGQNAFTGTIVKTFTIAKANNSLNAKGKTAKVKAKKLKKKAQKLAASKVLALANKGQGTVTYKLASVKKAKFKKFFKVDAKTGNITVKKGLKKKGTYKVTVAVKAAGDTNHKALSKNVLCKVKVK